MRRFFFTILFMTGFTPAIAAEAAVQKDPVTAGENGMTIQDCIGIMVGLNALDAGYRYIVAQGKPTESVETIKFKLPNNVRDAMSHNLFVLGQVQQESQAANRRIQLEIIGDKPDPIKDGSKELLIFNNRIAEYTARPCNVTLDHIRDADLDRAHNDIPSSVMALLTKIIDR